jgi:hypothetical protein
MLSLLFLLLACGDKPEDTGGLDISNAGPAGLSIANSACAADDGAAISISINTESKECDAQPTSGFNVQALINTGDMVSGQVYQLAPGFVADGHANYYYDGGSSLVSEGEIHLDFSGEWEDGVEYTGYYWINGDDMPLMEGSFEGVYCVSETMCG